MYSICSFMALSHIFLSFIHNSLFKIQFEKRGGKIYRMKKKKSREKWEEYKFLR